LIGDGGEQLGVKALPEALSIARERGLDLVEVAANTDPPVCKIMDFGKFKYETSKKEKASRKLQSTIVLKEIKLRPKTDEHDFDFKVKHIREFLAEGNKCKLVIVFRGREIVHPETGQDVLKRVVESTSDIAQVEQTPMMEGRRMLMIIAPRAGVIKAAAATQPRPAAPTPSPAQAMSAAAAPPPKAPVAAKPPPTK
jgi:translation initiation factor IF-3